MQSEARFHISNLLEYIKISNEVTQNEIANVLQCSSAMVTKIKKMNASLTAEQYFELLDHFEISGNPGKNGKFSAPTRSDIETFKCPKKLGKIFGSSGKSFSLYKDFFIKVYGEGSNIKGWKAFDEFVSNKNYKASYFYNRDNFSQFGLNCEIVKALRRKGYLLEDNQLKQFADFSFAQNEGIEKFKSTTSSGLTRIKAWLEMLPQIEQNHDYKINDYSSSRGILEFSYKPKKDSESHKIWKEDRDSAAFTDRWLGIGSFCMGEDYRNSTITFLESFNQGKGQTVCRVKSNEPIYH